VDTHPIHVHLFGAQLINRVAWDGKILPPDANELGWKETIRVNPLEHAIVAFRTTVPKNQPFEIPNSIRSIDPSMPDGVVLPGPLGGYKDPQGNPVTVVNHKVNYGWEYMYHCHILAHEEMDMMHSMVLAVAPRPPTNLVASAIKPAAGGRFRTDLSWKDNSTTETGFTIERATNSNFTPVESTFKVGANIRTYGDNTLGRRQTYYYRVQANNVVGDATVYPAPAVGFPTMSANSAFSNNVSITTPR